MRSAMWFGLAIFLLAAVIGCGGSPVNAIIEEEKEWHKESTDPAKAAIMLDRRKEIDRKIANLTPEQKEEYKKRRAAEKLPPMP